MEKWNAVTKSNANQTYILPALLKVNDYLTLYLKENKTWEYVQPETLRPESCSKSITIYPEKYKSISYENLEKKPQVLSVVRPHYPHNLRVKGIEGECSTEMDIEPDGSVSACKIIDSSGYCEFDFCSLCAGLKYRFTPALQNGVPVRVKIGHKHRYILH